MDAGELAEHELERQRAKVVVAPVEATLAKIQTEAIPVSCRENCVERRNPM
jgi:hypothetical protein